MTSATGAVPTTGVVPAPKNADLAILEPWPEGQPLFRVHRTGTDARRFNPGFGSPTRFAFFNDAAGSIVPSWYGGETLNVAIAESLFHDLPLGPGSILPASSYSDRSHSVVAPRRTLALVSLVDHGLRALGLRASQITDTDAIDYPDTIAWAQAMHNALPHADGIVWMSRQFNSRRAVSLFGDRVAPKDLDVEMLKPSVEFDHGIGLGELLISADRASILVEPPARKYLT